MKKLFTSESVGAGHPDKICDQISDSILDAVLREDKNARVACEVMASNHLIVIGGEITTHCYVDVVSIAWKVLKVLDYLEEEFTIISNINKQSVDINQGVNKKGGSGAGDQGIMFGYATNETKQYMPLPIAMSHELVKIAEKLRLSNEFKNAKSDMKSQVTIDYTNETKIDTILMSIQHEEVNQEEYQKFKNFIKTNVMEVVAKKFNMNLNYKVLINPTGKFVIGGPMGDTGLTGRKIIVDTYGGKGRHGGGSFSGKDYTKVDRSGAYAARWIAKNLVASGLASEVEIQISYAIGISKPVSINVNTFGTGKIADEKIADIINNNFDLTPDGIVNSLEMKKPIFQQTSTFGHFGRDDLDLPWERLNKINIFKNIN
ncbi:MAG: methionine adenosyltransferase [Mollicutes bacterium PWAP]|nr:methionine adenosyltransferase [Mollicutes bacterium PWAP]